ncbi:GAF domain-containing protein [Saccharicrinis sp. FJH2]|uniref:GAF domain-containing protein n=1 Tax=Saccharicrinis sp. FJH65 TaxID=3344659 RepID=UPI0035F364B2
MNAKTKAARYERMYLQIKDLVEPVKNPVSRMATIAAVLHHKMDYFFWTGFYLLDGEQLHVGPYQGPLACLRLKQHTGVCWAAIDRKETVVVGNVEEFPGHIACSSLSNSEIVVPLINGDTVTGCLDVDSRDLNSFDETDREGLEKIIGLIYG